LGEEISEGLSKAFKKMAEVAHPGHVALPALEVDSSRSSLVDALDAAASHFFSPLSSFRRPHLLMKAIEKA
jgi:hypothetical protein